MKIPFIILLLCAAPSLAQAAAEGAAPRQAAVAERGAAVMPFRLSATKHVFTPTAEGGRQRVVVRNAADRQQVALIRSHLKDLRRRFESGDFSAPETIHGAAMPGLQALKSARRGELAVVYRDLPAGGELNYRSKKPQLVAALHQWFDAQLADHGADAVSGHAHGSGGHRH